ncbi:hypothetical protein TNCV_839461 [Trichonephila clavipes]|nr:hypothetical protein TNCV_839461 [Trichonephila clavipes]
MLFTEIAMNWDMDLSFISDEALVPPEGLCQLTRNVYHNHPHSLQELQQNVYDEITLIPAFQLRFAIHNLLTRAQVLDPSPDATKNCHVERLMSIKYVEALSRRLGTEV